MVKGSECIKFEAQLVVHLEGEDSPEVREHAARCAACSALLADLKLIRSAARQIPLEDPPPRTWERIRAALVEEGAFRRSPSAWQRWLRGWGLTPTPAPVAALAGVAILGVALLLSTRVQNPPLTQSDTLTASAVRTDFGPDLSDEDALGKTIKEMETSYHLQMTSLEPSLRAVYEKSLASLDNSITQCRNSVREEPSNDLAHEYLLNAYAQKAEVLASALEYEGR